MKLDIPTILSNASKKYHRLILIIGLPHSGKTEILERFGEHYPSSYINLALVLSEKLLNFSSNQRKNALNQMITEIIEPFHDKVLLFDNIELLFDPELQVDVLDLFRKISRHQICVICWSGVIKNDKVRFGDHGFWGDSYDIGEIEVIDLNGVSDEV